MTEEGSNVTLDIGAVLAETYQIERRLNEGGMGAVFVARHLRLGERRVAIKVLFDRFPPGGELRARFRREAEVCASLNHPNIVSVTDWNELPTGAPYLVMELLEGEDLATRLSRGDIPSEEIVHILEGIVEGLSAAHAKKVVHRDLKPGNVFLIKTAIENKPHVKLLDFGISKIVDAKTLITTGTRLIGTPRYMSPEQAHGKDDLNERSDQFSLACIAYEMIGGMSAFGGTTLQSVLFNIVHDAPEPLSELEPETPKRWIKAIYQALAKDPRDRFPTVREFWEEFISKSPEPSDEEILEVYRRAGGGGVSVSTTVKVPVEPLTPIRSKTPQTPQHLVPSSKAKRLGIQILLGVCIIGLGLGGAMLARFWRDSSKEKVEQVIPEPALVELTPNQAISGMNRQQAATTPSKKSRAVAAQRNNAEEQVRHVEEKVEVAIKLDQAQAAYEQGKFLEAIRFALQTLSDQDTPRARRLIAMSYCQIGDLGNAKSAIIKVASQDRAAILDICKAKGLDL